MTGWKHKTEAIDKWNVAKGFTNTYNDEDEKSQIEWSCNSFIALPWNERTLRQKKDIIEILKKSDIEDLSHYWVETDYEGDMPSEIIKSKLILPSDKGSLKIAPFMRFKVRYGPTSHRSPPLAWKSVPPTLPRIRGTHGH